MFGTKAVHFVPFEAAVLLHPGALFYTETSQTAGALLTGPAHKTAQHSPTHAHECKTTGPASAGYMRVLILLLYSKLSSLCLMPNRKAL